MCKNSVRTSQRIEYGSITKADRLILYREITAACRYHSHAAQINGSVWTKCGVFIVKSGGVCANY